MLGNLMFAVHALAGDIKIVANPSVRADSITPAETSGDFAAAGVKVLVISQPGVNAERQLITRVEPEYPEMLQHLQIGGTVRLMVTISPNGSVESARVLGGNPILAESAIKAVKRWVYTASPSRSMQEVPIPFVPK